MKKFADSSEEYVSNTGYNYVRDLHGRIIRSGGKVVDREHARQRLREMAAAAATQQRTDNDQQRQDMMNAANAGARAARELQQYGGPFDPPYDSWGGALSNSQPVTENDTQEEEEKKPAPKPKKSKAPPANEFI